MDSLDVYVKKREERRQRLKTPVKRAAAFAAKIAAGQPQRETSAAKVYSVHATNQSFWLDFNTNIPFPPTRSI